MNEPKSEDVMRALEICAKPYAQNKVSKCKTCPYWERECHKEFIPDVLALLREKDALIELLQDDLFRAKNLYCDLVGESNEKDAEIERLNALNKVLKDNNSQCHRLGYEDAITEFAKRLKANNPKTVGCDVFYPFVYFETIDQIAKEMKGN